MAAISAKIRTVGRDGAFCIIDPACPELGETFYTMRHQPLADRLLGIRISRQRYPLVWSQDDAAGETVSVCFAGLESLVVQRLRQLGRPVRRVSTAGANLTPPAYIPWELDQKDEAVLNLVQQHERGLLFYNRSNVDPAQLIAQVALGWRTRRVVVPVTRTKDAWELWRSLAEYLPAGDIGVYTHRTSAAEPKRIAIGCYAQLGQGAVELQRRQLLVAVNPIDLLTHEYGRETLKRAKAARLYGPLPDDQRLAPYQRDLLRAVFGSRRVSIPEHGKALRPVRVVFAPIYGGGRLDSSMDTLRLKQLGVWHHPVRNRRIAQFAKALATGDRPKLQELCPDIMSGVRQLHRARIGVLVENVDHALSLGKRLSDWPILGGDSILLDGLAVSDQARLQQAAPRRSHAIVTMAALPHAGRFDILIRADAGLGTPELDLRVNTYVNGRRPRSMTLIDFDDRHHPELQQRSQRRRNAYLQAGWHLMQDEASELDHYLRQRPQVDKR